MPHCRVLQVLEDADWFKSNASGGAPPLGLSKGSASAVHQQAVPLSLLVLVSRIPRVIFWKNG